MLFTEFVSDENVTLTYWILIYHRAHQRKNPKVEKLTFFMLMKTGVYKRKPSSRLPTVDTYLWESEWWKGWRSEVREIIFFIHSLTGAISHTLCLQLDFNPHVALCRYMNPTALFNAFTWCALEQLLRMSKLDIDLGIITDVHSIAIHLASTSSLSSHPYLYPHSTNYLLLCSF